MRSPFVALGCVLALAPACAGGDGDVEDGEFDSFGGKSDVPTEGSAEARAVLALVNDLEVDFAELDVDANLSSRVARNIINHRDGADAAPGTSDDDLFDTLAELDAIPYLGSATLEQLLEYAREKGLLNDAARVEVIFSPQPSASSHTARVAQMIDRAEETVDVAMYSFSDAAVKTALTNAHARGVKIRFLFDTANEDRMITDLAARTASKSGALEKLGIDVRYVNKILHHKFVLIDGARDDAELAKTGKLVTGSANWSSGGATIYDENTLFIDGSHELNIAFQKEFDYLWSHSRDFLLASPLPYELATAELDDGVDDRAVESLFTSDNFNISGTTFSLDWRRHGVSDALTAAIDRAEESIWVAEGHLRLRPVAEALVRKKQSDPSIDIKVYLDQQEYMSASGDSTQKAEVAACLAAAGSDERKQYDCLSKDFLFSKMLVDAGIDLRFKVYAYRWDFSYAVQMHSKYIIIDGKELYTGSYNLSTNSEQGTFENVVHLSAPEYSGVIDAFETNFRTMYEVNRTALEPLRDTISTSSTIPMVFPSMALTYQEFTDLKTLIRTNCTLADSTDFRANPAAHRTCARQ